MTVNVLGVDLDLDVYDVDVFEKFEKEVTEVKRKVDESVTEKTNAQKLRRHCTIVKEFFDNVFGPGTSRKLFNGKDNIKDCTDAYLTVISAVGMATHEYSDAINEKRADIESKYAPEEDDRETARQQAAFRKAATSQYVGNRAQRRSSKKKKR
mgnify:CR=1 FL=1